MRAAIAGRIAANVLDAGRSVAAPAATLRPCASRPGTSTRSRPGRRPWSCGSRRREPDVLLIQETKLSDADAPIMPMRMLGYEMAHHGEGRWNGVAILSRVGIEDVVTNFGDGPVRDSTRRGRGRGLRGRLRPVRRGADGLRRVRRRPGREPVRAERPGRRLAVLRGQAALVRAAPALAGRDAGARRAAAPRRRLQRDPGATRTSGARRKAHGGTHVSEPEREALADLRAWGLVGHLPLPAARARPLLVVGLPGRHVPPQRGHADRPAVRDRARRGRVPSGPRSTARRARARRRRPTTRRW